MEDYFLGNSFDVGEKGVGVQDISFLVERSIGVPRTDGFFEFRDRESVFFNEVVVDAGDVCTTINESVGVDGFQSMRGYDELQRDSHRFAGHWYRYRRTSNFWGCSCRSRFPF